MTAKIDLERRNRLAYLALYYAINGDDRRSERVRRLIWQLENGPPPHAYSEPVYEDPVLA